MPRRLGVATALSFVVTPMGTAFHAHAIELARAVVQGAAAEEAWRREQEERVQSSQAVARALAALPLPAGDADEALHQAHMLRMLGSIAHVSRCPPQQLAACAGLPLEDAEELAHFFSATQPDPAADPPPADPAARPMLSL